MQATLTEYVTIVYVRCKECGKSELLPEVLPGLKCDSCGKYYEYEIIEEEAL